MLRWKEEPKSVSHLILCAWVNKLEGEKKTKYKFMYHLHNFQKLFLKNHEKNSTTKGTSVREGLKPTEEHH